ncbi:MAG: DUF1992 domain-containing protein, partial [Chloroflexota bacterium]|nr:DUF1992 domain-containing protein [Chloroflexota bacterium]
MAPTRESLAERLIREAQEQGAFENLPYRGEQLPLDDDTWAAEMALAFRVLRNAGAAPPWVEADKEVRRLLAERDLLLERAARAGPLAAPRYRKRLAELVGEVNHAVASLNAEAPSSVHRRPLDPPTEAAALE